MLTKTDACLAGLLIAVSEINEAVYYAYREN